MPNMLMAFHIDISYLNHSLQRAQPRTLHFVDKKKRWCDFSGEYIICEYVGAL